nr:MAG TPA: hypothetical protein [Caudoviricetes sp.]
MYITPTSGDIKQYSSLGIRDIFTVWPLEIIS